MNTIPTAFHFQLSSVVTLYVKTVCIIIMFINRRALIQRASSEASPTFGHANANLNHYHYLFL